MDTSKASVVSERIGDGLTRLWDIHEVIVESRTKYQNLVIARTGQGVALFCDGERQSTEFSQLTYHEALVVPALLLADAVGSVLIIGSSEGVASQLAVAAGAVTVDHVDIDEEAVRLCAEHLPYGYTTDALRAAERGQGPVTVHYQDGFQFVADAVENGRRYDVIVIDLPDEQEDDVQQNRLYGVEFLAMCRAALTDGGVLAGQAGCQTMWRNRSLVESWRRFTSTFGTVAYYGSDEHEWAFLFGRADRLAAPTDRMVERLPACGYTPASIDALAISGNSIPPYRVRHQA
jgi:spermidine synthase